jgi:LAS superfamily LD-carboxypeptidase LdcB
MNLEKNTTPQNNINKYLPPYKVLLPPPELEKIENNKVDTLEIDFHLASQNLIIRESFDLEYESKTIKKAEKNQKRFKLHLLISSSAVLTLIVVLFAYFWIASKDLGEAQAKCQSLRNELIDNASLDIYSDSKCNIVDLSNQNAWLQFYNWGNLTQSLKLKNLNYQKTKLFFNEKYNSMEEEYSSKLISFTSSGIFLDEISKLEEINKDDSITDKNTKLENNINVLNDLEVKFKQLIEKDFEDFEQKINFYKIYTNLDKYNIWFNGFRSKNLRYILENYQEFVKNRSDLNTFTSQLLEQLYETDYVKAEILEKQLLKSFFGNEFKELYNSNVYEKVSEPKLKNIIFGYQEVDDKIFNLAEVRGYQKRANADESLLEITDNNQKLQKETKNAFLKLKEDAKKENLDLVLVSGYRSVEEQREIFLSRMDSNITLEQITTGQADTQINQLLDTTSPPSKSRHHTGYTFDLGCGSFELTNFESTPCFEWISRDNYFKAKKYGLIPSYPPGAEIQGPKPEAWEYVYVGVDKLRL